MKKIAIFQTDLNIGGIQKSLINLLDNIDYQQFDIDLYLTTVDNLLINDINKNVNVHNLKNLPFFTKLIPFKILKYFYKNKIKQEYDVSIDFNSYSMDTSLAALNVEANKRVIWVHNDIDIKLKEEFKYRILYFFFKSKYKYFDEFVVVSTGALESFKKHQQFNSKKYNVIPNFIDTNAIVKKCQESTEFVVNRQKYNMCTIGRLVHQKGFDILLKNIKELIEHRKDFHLYIIGDGKEKENLLKYVNDNDMNEYVTFTGYKKNPYSIMNMMDGFVLTSRYEGQGMVFLEAKCLGLDIVMPKHLEKYVDGIKGTNNILSDLISLKKHDKKIDYLKEYNEEIINKINKLFNE